MKDPPGSQSDAHALFPLALTPFERYMVVEDRPDYSMSFVIVCEVQGRPQEQPLRQAFQHALQRHPLLASQLVPCGRKSVWTVSETQPQVEWFESSVESMSCPVSSPAPTPIPECRAKRLTACSPSGHGIGLRVYTEADQAQLHFCFHHALSDGVGGLQFVGDVLALYGQLTATSALRPRLLPIDAQLLRTRHRFDIRIPHPVSRWVAYKAMLSEMWRVLIRRPCVLSTPTVVPTQPNSQPIAMAKIVLRACESSAYAQAAAASGVTVNDLLLRDLFMTVRHWNARYASAKSRDWMRITVPTNLRYRKALRMPAANMIGYAFITHRVAECDHPQALLESTSREMKAVTQWGLGVFFVNAIAQLDRLPGLLHLCTRANSRFSTLVLSNLGDGLRRFRARFPVIDGRATAGDLVVKNLYGAPPVRPGTRLTVGICGYAQQMTLAARYDSQMFGREIAQRFLETLRQHMLVSAQAAKTRGKPIDGPLDCQG